MAIYNVLYKVLEKIVEDHEALLLSNLILKVCIIDIISQVVLKKEVFVPYLG